MNNKRPANTIFIIATLLVVVITIMYGFHENKRDREFRCDILHAQLQLNNYRVNRIRNHNINDLEERSPIPNGVNFIRDVNTIRVTVIDKHGNVIYDSNENLTEMSNHLSRKEVQEALKNGTGYDIKRRSDSNGEIYFYSATYFPERAEIIRSAVQYSVPLTASLERDYTFLYYTAGILLLVGGVLYFRVRLRFSEQEKQRIKRQLTENAAHELKTPAATIHGYLETLVENPTLPEAKKKEFIDRCFSQSKRMTSLLADMSMLSQLDNTVFKRSTTMIDVVDILNQIADETMPQFEDRNLELRMSLPEHLPLQGDQAHIYSLFRNIFNNVLAYANEATYFEVKATQSYDSYTFMLIDNGVGVPYEHLPHLFERFYRLDKGRSRRLGGTGLGLAIVKNIAIQYGGSATASITPGGGLSIEIILKAK